MSGSEATRNLVEVGAYRPVPLVAAPRSTSSGPRGSGGTDGEAAPIDWMDAISTSANMKDGGQLTVREIDPLNDPDWDRDLTRFPNATFFHTAGWARVLRETYGYPPRFLVASEGGQTRGILPLMEVDSRLTGRRGVSLPFSDYCPALGTDRDAMASLFDAALRMGRERKWRYVEFRGAAALAVSSPASARFLVHSLPLSSNEDALFDRCASSVRRAIRKAHREGVRVEISRDIGTVRAFYRLQCRTRRRLGLPPQPYRFFAALHRHVMSKGVGFATLARHADRPIAAAVFGHFGRQAVYKYGASDERYSSLRGNNVVLWESIRHLARHGFQSLSLGRTDLEDEGLRRFKLGWGTREATLQYHRYDLGGGRFVAGSRPGPAWSRRTCRWLPTPLLRLAGAVLYRHIG